jgi:hypothetical protein
MLHAIFVKGSRSDAVSRKAVKERAGMLKTWTATPHTLPSRPVFDRKLTMKKLFATGGIALALLLSACATAQSPDGGPQFERQDIVREMNR